MIKSLNFDYSGPIDDIYFCVIKELKRLQKKKGPNLSHYYHKGKGLQAEEDQVKIPCLENLMLQLEKSILIRSLPQNIRMFWLDRLDWPEKRKIIGYTGNAIGSSLKFMMMPFQQRALTWAAATYNFSRRMVAQQGMVLLQYLLTFYKEHTTK
jgi:hypothetical protein